jgi:hypothetical protein
MESGLQRPAARRVEHREAVVIEAESHHVADACRGARRQPCLHLDTPVYYGPGYYPPHTSQHGTVQY